MVTSFFTKHFSACSVGPLKAFARRFIQPGALGVAAGDPTDTPALQLDAAISCSVGGNSR